MQDEFNQISGGPLEWGYVDEKTGLWTPQGYKEKNLVLYGAADILAKLIGGDTSYAITTMYFEFTNGVVPAVVPTRGGGQSYYSGLAAPKDFVRAALDISPTYAKSGNDYTNNITRFFGTTIGSAGHNGEAFSQAAGSTVYGGALVATPTGSFAGDIVFARFYLTTPIAKLDGMQIGFKWGMLFN